MTTENKKELMNEAYDVVLRSEGIIGISMVSKKILGEKLTTASTLMDMAKLAVGVTTSSMLVKWAQEKKYLPVDPKNCKCPYYLKWKKKKRVYHLKIILYISILNND